MLASERTIYTIGHSKHSLAHFIALLHSHGLTLLFDVRSHSYSRFFPHFNRRALDTALAAHGIEYRFAGDELGGRPADPTLYDPEGHVRYDTLSRTPAFQCGITRILTAATEFPFALMCSEENPAACHRHLLIARVLHDRGATIIHIRGSGLLHSYERIEAQIDPPRSASLFERSEAAAWRSKSPIRSPRVSRDSAGRRPTDTPRTRRTGTR